MIHKHIAGLFLSAALIVPAYALATRPSAKQDAGVQIRVYDSEHKDYHDWDDNESRAWGQYLSENHKKAHNFQKADKKEQSDYWNWRHAHPDTDDKDKHYLSVRLGRCNESGKIPRDASSNARSLSASVAKGEGQCHSDFTRSDLS